MHHYRTREDETPCGGDPYFYLRLSAGAAPYSPIKLEVDVKPEPHMTPVDCLQHGSPPADSGSAVMDTVGGCGNAAVVADIGGCGGVIVGGGAGVRCKDEGGATGIGLLALTQLDGYGGYNNKSYCHADGGAVDLQLQHDRVGDDDVDKEHSKYSYGRLIYSSPDDDSVIKHQYGGDEFTPDPARFAAQKPGSSVYNADSYYLDGTGNNSDVWTTSATAQLQSPTTYTTYTNPPNSLLTTSPNMTPNNFPPTNTMLTPENLGYNTIGPNASIPPSGVSPATDGLGTSPLPPMSSLRGVPPSAPSPIAVTPSSMMYPGHNSPTIQSPGDTLVKTLASIYPTDQSVSSYSSNPSTPVSSPPPLAPLAPANSAGSWTPGVVPPHPGSPHFPTDHRTIHLGSRMEERLDDAINVLRNHAESQALSLAGVQHSASGIVPLYHQHLGSPHSATATVGGVPNTYQTLSTCQDSDGPIKIERLSNIKKRKEPPDSSDTKPTSSDHLLVNNIVNANSPPNNSPINKNSKRPRRYCSSADEDNEDPSTKAHREKERRQANNVRERIRIRDINEALKELGRMCMTHLKTDKPQTKLGILNMAVEVIMSLEQQVRERNLNPKAACLKRREEEKAEDNVGPKLGHHLSVAQHMVVQAPHFPPMTLPNNQAGLPHNGPQ
ncbi:transcription factor 12 isoform X1 [Acyrthosiphon pisum]|uniref:BHLH domain-containing protein n=1 Tax=Acyrthosiphon pisum TaxID=7029 RepID=A0A8R2D707_ACYPI|nr:transcription factor 12 isoform X1 [Acyrthosiphon pisum]|eukprot:XP_016663921.1 PREDICTED: transcription factor 12 isoform X1 [Acyrthosiphon pisum]